MINFSDVQINIVLVDDEQSELDAYSFLLMSMGLKNVTTIQDSRKLIPAMERLHPAIIFLDLNMPHKSGQEVLAELKENYPDSPVIICTANSDIATAVQCLKLGAHDYLVKPISMESFGSALRNALEISALRNEILTLKGLSFNRHLNTPEHFKDIITRNPMMLNLFRYIESISVSSQPVLILGETGSGKELFARAIHDVSRKKGKFVAVDVSGLDDTLFSDALFGHKKGAYTGANSSRTGLIEAAAGGTIFLDEIGDLAKSSQIKLLRLLQEGIYYPLGEDTPKQCHARVITATNKKLNQMAGKADDFRIDLYYRLSTHLIQIPPLRERLEDIPLITTYLADKAAKSMGKSIERVGENLLDILSTMPFPGNVRELKTYIYDAVAQCQTLELTEHDIMERLTPAGTPGDHFREQSPGIQLETLFGKFPTLTQIVEFTIDRAMEKANQNQSKAAAFLGISKQALNKRINKRKLN